ncbi:MAG: signal recognition particle protein [Alphaproteobacteria bacterium]
MFQQLTDRLTPLLQKLKGKGALCEEDVGAALREIRIALLEADVALSVVKAFVESVREKAVGQDVLKSITPGQMVVKIVHDHLVSLLDAPNAAINLAAVPPAVILMVGLQGSGKTTSTAKLASWLAARENKKVLVASLDVYRPAAQQQLEILAQQINIASVPIVPAEKPLEIAKRALKMARLEGFDVVLLDTAGRLHLDDALMEELRVLQRETNPQETLFVADAMTGQDAVHSAKAFQEVLPLTGVVLSRMDGDMRGGAALSVRHVTGCPIKFMGVGEKPDQLERFHAERVAGRILGMGDIVSLVEKAAETIEQSEMEKMAQQLEKGSFNLNDLAQQIKQIQKLGGLGGLLNFMPGMGGLKDKLQQAKLDDRIIQHQLAILSSMTPKERLKPEILNGSRRRRIAQGSGRSIQEVNKLLKQHEQMSLMMKRMKKMGKKGMTRQGFRGLLQR